MKHRQRSLIAAILAGILAVPLVGSAVALGHERCVDTAVIQVIANGIGGAVQLVGEGDPAGYESNPVGHDRGVRHARNMSPAIVSCPDD